MGLEGTGFLWVFLLREKQPGVYVLMNVSQLRRVFRKGRRAKKGRQLELDLWPGKRIKPVAVADRGRSPQSALGRLYLAWSFSRQSAPANERYFPEVIR
jgi:hypothetical protein